jgi:phage FluMu protein Com
VLRHFVGAVELRCRRCTGAWLRISAYEDGSAHERASRVEPRHWLPGGGPNRCRSCKRVLLSSAITSGAVEIICRRCSGPNTFGTVPDFTPRAPEQLTEDRLVVLMEERWTEAAKRRAKLRAEVAVGLRFDVFRRDGFRCRYCGRSVEDGAILHADHVIPESKGGPTTLENLVTACQECNIGKSDKTI